MYLKYGRGRGNRRVRGLNAAGGVNGESGLDELPLEFVGGVGGGLEVAGMLFGCPFAAGVAYDKCEDSHGYSVRNPNSKLKTRKEQIAVTAICVREIAYVPVRFWNPNAVHVKSPFSPLQYYNNICKSHSYMKF